jgi:hypothetical protein
MHSGFAPLLRIFHAKNPQKKTTSVTPAMKSTPVHTDASP